MPFTLSEVIPWGRSMGEYIAMFALSEQDMDVKILSCADGPASFNAEMNTRNRQVVSVDPVYQFSGAEIQCRIDAVYPIVMAQLKDNRDAYVWGNITSSEALGELRLQAMAMFLADFRQGKKEDRYFCQSFPDLSFQDQEFDLALCSHFLFLYSEHLSLDFHQQSIQEMLRVAKEIRIFPLLDLAGQRSPHLDPVCAWLIKSGLKYEIRTVGYEFQRGGNQMLQVWRNR